MKRRCIGYTSTWHRTQRELSICKRLLVHSGKPMNWSRMKPLQSCAKDIQHNWGMLPPHSCLSVTRQICLGGFGIRKIQEYQAEIAAHPARFGTDITGAQLALTAE